MQWLSAQPLYLVPTVKCQSDKISFWEWEVVRHKTSGLLKRVNQTATSHDFDKRVMSQSDSNKSWLWWKGHESIRQQQVMTLMKGSWVITKFGLEYNIFFLFYKKVSLNRYCTLNTNKNNNLTNSGMSTIIGYLMPNPVFTYILKIWFVNTFINKYS